MLTMAFDSARLFNAISAALFHRERSGEGQAIEIPMFEVFVEYLLGDHLSGLTFDPPEGPQYYPRLVSKHRKPYATSDGYVCALVYTDTHWKNFFKAIAREDLLQDPRFSTHGGRADNIDAVYAFVADTLKERTTAEWLALLDCAGLSIVAQQDEFCACLPADLEQPLCLPVSQLPRLVDQQNVGFGEVPSAACQQAGHGSRINACPVA